MASPQRAGGSGSPRPVPSRPSVTAPLPTVRIGEETLPTGSKSRAARRRRARRRSLAPDLDRSDSQVPAGDSAGLPQSLEPFYRNETAAVSATSIDSEVLLDHRCVILDADAQTPN